VWWIHAERMQSSLPLRHEQHHQRYRIRRGCQIARSPARGTRVRWWVELPAGQQLLVQVQVCSAVPVPAVASLMAAKVTP